MSQIYVITNISSYSMAYLTENNYRIVRKLISIRYYQETRTFLNIPWCAADLIHVSRINIFLGKVILFSKRVCLMHSVVSSLMSFQIISSLHEHTRICLLRVCDALRTFITERNLAFFVVG
jgi:hypothetical protein